MSFTTYVWLLMTEGAIVNPLVETIATMKFIVAACLEVVLVFAVTLIVYCPASISSEVTTFKLKALLSNVIKAGKG